MKKVLLTTMIALVGTSFVSCSSDGSDDNPTTPKYKIHDGNIVGVWKSGSDCFISFSSDNYNSALLNNKFIDEGSYTIKDDTITVSNQYFGKKTRYVINDLTDNSITVSVTYSDRWDGEKTTKMQFLKADDTPCSKINELVGKSYMAQYSVSHGSQHWNKTFSSNNIINCVNTDAASLAPFTFYYVYLPPKKIYFYTIRYNDFYYDTVRYDNIELDENNQIKYMSSLYGQKMY